MNEAQKLDFLNKMVNVKIFGKDIKFMNLFKLTVYEHLQTLFMTIYIIFVFGTGWQIPTIVILFTNWTPRLRYIYILYLCWFFYDRKAPKNGRRWPWFRKLRLFQFYDDYFPIRLIKTADLTPDRNYLLAFYPHALVPASILTTFGFNNHYLDKLYPNIDFAYVTLNFITGTPLLRELYLSVGARSADKSDVENYLNSEPSKALLITPEGVSGQQVTRPGNEYWFRKKHRKGFIRVALRTGASLVPVFTFNENRVFTVVQVSGWLKTLSDFLYKMSRVQPVIFNGAGIFQQSFGLMPKRIPLTTVVGKPIPVPKVENPSEQLVDEFLEKFFKELENLFEEYKHEYDLSGSQARIKYL